MTVLDSTALEDLPPLLRPAEVARILRTTENSLNQDRYLGLGCPTSAAVGGFSMPAMTSLTTCASTRCSPATSRSHRHPRRSTQIAPRPVSRD